MKKIIALLLAAIMVFSLTACSSQNNNQNNNQGTAAPGNSGSTGTDTNASQGTIKVGLITPMTGDSSVYGNQMCAGLDLLFDEINANGGVLGGMKIEYEIFDDKEDPAESPIGATKFIADESICAIFGAHNSGNSLAIVNQVQEANMLMLNCSSSNMDLIEYDNFYRTVASAKDQGTFLGKWVANDFKNVAFIAANNDWGKDMLASVRDAFEANGGTVTTVENVDPAANDFRSALTRINATNPEAVVLVTTYNGSPLIINQGKELGLDMPWYGCCGLMENELLTAGGAAVEGIRFFAEFFSGDPDEGTQAFVEKYKAKYGEEPGLQACLAYDMGSMFIAILEKAGTTDRAALYEAAKNIEFQGVNNYYTYNGNVLNVKSFSKITVENGQFKAYVD